jgi:sulfite reductase alpha subunit-like flavoprotein
MADMAIAYGNVYVANCSMGANMQQTLKSLIEAEAYPGPSLVLAYSPCIEHKNVDGMSHTMQHMEVAANSGYYPLFRYNPMLKKEGKAPFILDTKKITADVSRVIESEMRYGAMKKRDVEKFEKNLENLRAWINERFEHLQQLSQIVPSGSSQTAIASAVSGESRPLTILYGSETGNTQELAYRTGELAKQRGFDVLIKELDEVPVETLGEHPNVLIMCSTCGEGDIPRNAQSFMEELEKASESKAVNLSHVNYAVFAMGDSSYHEFCKVGKDIDELLSRVGAQRSLAIGIGNDRDEDKFETGFEAWAPQFWTVQKAPEPAVSGPPESLFEIVSLNEDNVKAPYKAITAPGAVLASVDLCKRLTPSDYSRDIRHVQIALKNGQDLPYMLGDVLNLYPRNDSVRVRSFLTAFGEDPEEMVKLTPSAGANMDARKRAASLRPRTLEQVLTEVLDIFGRPNRGFYKTLARFAEDGSKAKTELELLAGDSVEGRKMYSDVTSESLTYGDIILKYMDEAKPSIEHLITVIPPVKPRLYSIASSPRFVGPNLVELVVVINEWKTPSGQIRRGTGTNYVQSLKNGDEVACTITSGTFKFPESPMTPMIMAGLGTGLAPFRAFVQERQWMKDQGLTTGPMWLFYGCRYRSKDYIFGDELEKYAADGVITELQPAFSRDTAKKVYVQNKIMDNHKRVYEDLVEKNGFFYLCGQAGQAELDIKEAIYQSMAKGLGVSRDEAVEKFEQLAEEGRYCPELY